MAGRTEGKRSGAGQTGRKEVTQMGRVEQAFAVVQALSERQAKAARYGDSVVTIQQRSWRLKAALKAYANALSECGAV